MTTQLLWWHFLNSRCVYFKRTYLACRHSLHLTNTLFIACWHWKWKHYILNAAFISPSVQEYSHKVCSLTCPTSKYSTVLDLTKEGKESSSYNCSQELCIQHIQLLAVWDVTLSCWRKEQVHWQQDRCSANGVRMWCISLQIYGLI